MEVFVLMVRKPLMPVRGMRGELTRLPPCASHFPFSPPGLSQITWSKSVEKGRGYYKLGPQATLWWRKASYHVDVHELSPFHNPILYRTARCKTPCVQGGTHPFLHATNSDKLHERMIRRTRGPYPAKSCVRLAWRYSRASLMPNFTGWLLTSDSEIMQYTPHPS